MTMGVVHEHFIELVCVYLKVERIVRRKGHDVMDPPEKVISRIMRGEA